MKLNTTRFFYAGLLLLLVSLALVGPVSASTTINSLPYTITAPGCYELGHNFNNFEGPVAIDVRSSDVIIDGLGFELDGVDNLNSVGIWASSYRQNGIDYESANVTVQNIQFSNFAYGVLFCQAQGSVTGNTFTSNANGVAFQVVENSRILSNTFSGNGNGVTLFTATTTAINDNTFTMDGVAGLTVGTGSSESMIQNNRFTSEMLAILLNSGSTTATIKNNKIYATAAGDALKTGIQIAGSSGNTIYNNIFDTYTNVKATNTANTWNVASAGTNIVGGPSIGGNAWMMPNLAGFSQIYPDTNGDGFVDTTYFITNNNQDFLPLRVDQPAPNFIADVTEGPASLTVNFTDTSGGGVTGWKWNFGDGSTSTEQNPIHIYSTPGLYSVQLTASNAGGSNSLTKTGFIIVRAPVTPVADFITDVTEGKAPLTVRFTDTSHGDVTGYEWNFGDGTTSTEQNPIHTYTDAGRYTVNFTVSGAGSSDSLVKPDLITVQGTTAPVTPPVASFDVNPTSGTAPLTVQFTDTSSNHPTGWVWTFGDSTTSSLQSPSHTYATAGTYTIQLNATNSAGFTLATGTVTVGSASPETTEPPVSAVLGVTAAFYTSGHIGQAPFPVQFQDLSTGSPTAWRWDFGDGSTSTEQNPLHTYTSTGAYTVSLSASSARAADTCIQYRCIIVNTVPVANFTANVTSGRPGLAVQFTDLSTGANGCQWQFGDGATSIEQNPTHVYTQPGTYSVTLTVCGTDYGSVFTQKQGYITITDSPVVGFSANVTAGESPLSVQFNESTSGQVQYYFWQFGDGSTSYEQNPVHLYGTVGIYTVSLMAIGPGGSEVKTLDQYINVTDPEETNEQHTNVTPTSVTPAPTEQNLPVADFTVTVGAAGSMSIEVADASANATSVLYDLGDGTTTSHRDFRYIYWQAGTHTIRQTATNAAGSANKTFTVTVPAAPATTPTVTATASQAPSVGTPFNEPHNLPGILQAEDYDVGGEGIAYHDTTAGNEGGAYRQDDVDLEVLDTDHSPSVGWTRAGEWLAYTMNIGTAGTYDAGFRVATSHDGSSIKVYLDDGTTPIATVNVPNTGYSAAFQTVSVPVTLPAGAHRLKFSFPTDYVNLNWITFSRAA
ncbi:PKD domain-containing protein [Methanosphaerula subterraneus]|uniref:PKD domain-containing protein n=1 Tax=Methanosphaerula subterraneus TaxID=3350244 RepID=UPI003F835584